MGEFVEDTQDVFPRVASRIEVTGIAVCLSEVDEDVGFEVAVAEFPEQPGRALMAVDGLSGMARCAERGPAGAKTLLAFCVKPRGRAAARQDPCHRCASRSEKDP
jgi:hypothetical protein